MIYSSVHPHWQESNTILYDELILSWNGTRPEKPWTFWVYTDGWRKYAEWSKESQRTFDSDVISLEKPTKGFEVRVDGEDLSELKRLTVFLGLKSEYKIQSVPELTPVLIKGVPHLSQQILPHPRAKDLCSPTSLTNVLSYLSNRPLDPVKMADGAHDQGFDLYGNWTLNIAEGFHQTRIPCHVERLASFQKLHEHLLENRPVVVSVKGEIQGAPKSYPAGHLICVIGYSDGKVHCVDPAFPNNETTRVSYPIESFLKAWGIRRGLAYVFT